MTRIALASVGTTGDIRPFAALARRLIERGHDVPGITWPVHVDALAVPGMRTTAAGPHREPDALSAVAALAAASSPMDQVAILRDFHLERGEDHYRQLVDALAGHDLVVIHGIHALAHAAVLDLGVPWVSVVFDPVLLPTATAPPAGLPNLGPANRVAWWALDRALSGAARPLNALLGRAGSRQRGLPLFRARSLLLHLVGCSPSIVTLPPDAPRATRLTGAWLERSAPGPLPAAVERFLTDGPPPVVITFGSMAGPPASEVRDALRTLTAQGVRAIVQGDFATDPADRNVVHVGEVDHRALFPRAAAVVHHGGAGTTHAACAAGVPSVVVPHVGDQRWWGERLHRLGVAPPPVPAQRLSSTTLARVVAAAVRDDGLRQRARGMAAAIGAEDGTGVAADAIEAAA